MISTYVYEMGVMRRETMLNSLLELVEGPVGTLVYLLFGSGKVEGLDTSDSLSVSNWSPALSPFDSQI